MLVSSIFAKRSKKGFSYVEIKFVDGTKQAVQNMEDRDARILGSTKSEETEKEILEKYKNDFESVKE